MPLPDYENIHAYKAWCSETEDIQPEQVWFYCSHCEEEYLLPEEITVCPICDNSLEGSL